MIDADKVLKTLRMMQEGIPSYTGYHTAIVQMKKHIYDMPTVEAEPIRHGKWIRHKTPLGKEYGFICSECDDWANKCSKYCPYCGAKMDLEEDHFAEVRKMVGRENNESMESI